ncbi:CsbD family protein [Microtetraspora sp. NBRC 13810]|uniref:CsbD family protein n=1 Tax=Microtetraspora sp. NBRC 13810 TaxID=3030990 RepID=UPI0025579C42|nr:CsbD family protein [Microtetraspora sp. NBRC 13810]
MSAEDKLRNKAEQLKGKVKKNVGDATDDPKLQGEGRRDEAKGTMKQAGEKVKDAASNVKKTFKK